MDLSSTILDDVAIDCVIEIGRADAEAPWDAPAEFAAARIVRIEDRDDVASNPDRVVSEIDQPDSSAVVVVDHAADVLPESVRETFEMTFGRLPPGSLYMIDGSVERDMVLELMMAAVARPGVVDTVSLAPALVVVRRGRAEQSTEPIRLAELTSDPFGVTSQ